MRKTIVVLLVLCAKIAQAQIYIDSYRFAAAPAANLLLDDYPGATAAYSLRKLDKDYTGSAIRIRTAGGSETDIGFDSNGDLNTAAITTFCAGTTCTVATWYDQSGNGNNATQLTAANQPTIYTGGAVVAFNNRPAIDFDGSNDFFNTPPLDVFSGSFIPNTSFAVFRREATSTNFLGFGHNSLTAPYSPTMFSDGNTYLFSRRGGYAFFIYSNQNQNLFTGEEPASGNLSIYVNGLLGVSQYIAQARTMSDFYNTIGRLASDYSNSKTQELIFYQNVFNSTDRSGIESNINSYYSIY